MNINYNNKTPLAYKKLMYIESKIYQRQNIPKNTKPEDIKLDEILKRNKSLIREKTYNTPQNIFIIHGFNGYSIVGRKILSDLFIKNKINAINCSKITPSMLLGILRKNIKTGDDIIIEYHPFTNGEKLNAFLKLRSDILTSIEYPLRYIDFITKKEKTSPKNGWSLNKNKVIYLSNGEEHIRRYLIRYFKENQVDLNNKVIFDPACSTGKFLFDLKQNFPFSITIGQELSSQMVNYAKNYIDQAFHGNSINPQVGKNSVDILLLRFLNSEVVSTMMAYRLFVRLLNTVKTNGIIILIGHTPILIRERFFKKKNLSIIHSTGYDEETNSIFQCYLLKKMEVFQ